MFKNCSPLLGSPLPADFKPQNFPVATVPSQCNYNARNYAMCELIAPAKKTGWRALAESLMTPFYWKRVQFVVTTSSRTFGLHGWEKFFWLAKKLELRQTAVALPKADWTAVGHVPREFARVFWTTVEKSRVKWQVEESTINVLGTLRVQVSQLRKDHKDEGHPLWEVAKSNFSL